MKIGTHHNQMSCHLAQTQTQTETETQTEIHSKLESQTLRIPLPLLFCSMGFLIFLISLNIIVIIAGI